MNSTNDDDKNDTVFVSKEAMRRIISDIKQIKTSPLTEHGIYYEHDETDMLFGKALIIGPSDTPYENGFYLFKIRFPPNYPYSPPKLTFCTSDGGATRFNPNLYCSGKVCLSILNTWQGDQWTSCQTLSSVLLAVCTVFNSEPLLNEPGILRSNPDFEPYTEIIKYKNIEVAIFRILETVKDASYEFSLFGDIIREHYQKSKDKIRERIEEEMKKRGDNGVVSSGRVYNTNIYRLQTFVHYKPLLKVLDTY